MNLKRISGYLLLALVIYFIIVQPSAAADSVTSIGSGLRTAADSITEFFTTLTV